MAIDFKTFNKVAPLIARVKKPILLRGKHGTGKSETVYQFAGNVHNTLPDIYSGPLPVVERRASQMTEGDLIGLPSLDGGMTKWNPPDWFKLACDKPVVLFLDEVDRAVNEVRQGIFELTDSRKLNGWHLHPKTLIFAAVNGGTHGSQYQVGEMDPAELDRWTVFDVEPSVEDWLDYSKGKVHSIVWDFINQNRPHLEHKGEFEPNKVYPSRRSWFRLNECLSVSSLLDFDDKNKAGNLSMVFEVANAFVGVEAAVALRDFADKYQKQVTVEDVMVDGDFKKLDGWTINDYTAFVDKVTAHGILKNEFTDAIAKNATRLFITMPSEPAMKFWNSLAKQGIGNVKNIPIMNKSTYKGKSVNHHLVEIMTGKKVTVDKA